MHFLTSFFLLISLLWVNSPETTSFHGRVTAVKDGDTFKILHNGKEETVRLLHIDSPEKKQPFGSRAKQYASALCYGKFVTVVGKDRDRYGRLLAEVFVGKNCVNKMMVSAGMAWHFKKYSKNVEYSNLELTAQKRSLGLWQDKKAVAPWVWRKNKRLKGVTK